MVKLRDPERWLPPVIGGFVGTLVVVVVGLLAHPFNHVLNGLLFALILVFFGVSFVIVIVSAFMFLSTTFQGLTRLGWMVRGDARRRVVSPRPNTAPRLDDSPGLWDEWLDGGPALPKAGP